MGYETAGMAAWMHRNSRPDSREEKQLGRRLLRSVFNGMCGFSILYQPQIRASDGRCAGTEALLRWQDAGGNEYSPEVFVPVLESMGLIGKVGRWVFEEAARQCSRWLEGDAFEPDFCMSVNVSAAQLADEEFSWNCMVFLEELGLCPSNMMLEITESLPLQNFHQGVGQLKRLKQSGMKLALDDFGTGYSSLDYLRQIPADKVKIDASFIKDIEHNAFSREFVEWMIGITHGTGRTACFEGVETENQARILREMKSDEFQGFLYGSPQQPTDLVERNLNNKPQYSNT